MDREDGPRLMALVLTFDAPEHLLACVRGIQAQTVGPDAILIIDNHSPTPAQEVLVKAGLTSEKMTFLRLAENLGPAGGYARGLRRFAESDYDAAWVIDDDCVPDRECLSFLVEEYASTYAPGLIFPGAVFGPGGQIMNYPAWHGVLIPKAIVESLGVPREDFFWWAEDTEYLQWRIPRAGHSVVRVSGATMQHFWANPRKRAAWKYYYETRNSVYYRLRIQPRTELKVLALSLLRTFARILAFEDRKLLKLRFFLRGWRDGVAGRLGKRLHVPSRDETPHPLPGGDFPNRQHIG